MGLSCTTRVKLGLVGVNKCQSVQFPTNSISYSEVCGRVIGYYYGSPDALHTQQVGLNSHYVNSISYQVLDIPVGYYDIRFYVK